MTRKRGRAEVVKGGEEGQETVDEGDADYVPGATDPDSDDDFIEDPKKSCPRLCEKKSKVKISKLKKPSKSTVNENGSQVTETSVHEFTTPSTSPMVIIKTCNEDFINSLTKPDSIINSNNCAERPRSVSTPEQTSMGGEEKFSTPLSTPSRGSCDKLVQRLVSDLVTSTKSSLLDSLSSGLVPSTPDKTPLPSLEVLSSLTISQPPVSTQPPPVPSPQTTPSRVSSGHGNLIRAGQTLNHGQARQEPQGFRPQTVRPGPPRMPKPPTPRMIMPPRLPVPFPTAYGALGRPKPKVAQLNNARPRAVNQLEGPRPRATTLATIPMLASARLLAPARYSHMTNTQPASSGCIPPVVELDLSPDRPDHTQHPVLPPGISITRIPVGKDDSPSLSLPGLAEALLHLGAAEGRRRMVQYDLTEGQVKALSDLGVKEVVRM